MYKLKAITWLSKTKTHAIAKCFCRTFVVTKLYKKKKNQDCKVEIYECGKLIEESPILKSFDLAVYWAERKYNEYVESKVIGNIIELVEK